MKRMDNFLKFQDLRKDFPFFSFDAYDYNFTNDTLEVTYIFSLSNKHFFSPGISIPLKKGLFLPADSLSDKALDNLIFHAGMIELLSYWKAACPPFVIIKPFRLSASQIKFWKHIYFRGLGEFFYLNSIETNEDDFIDIQCTAEDQSVPFDVVLSEKCMVPVGGGKDSSVTMGILNNGGIAWNPMVINPTSVTRKVCQAAGKNPEDSIDVFRRIDPQLIRLNELQFLNGHTPFSAMLAFYSLLVAYLTGHKEIILSNESSANEATVPGTNINHQYSKTFEFEKDFRAYVKVFISGGFNYFSLLRPLSEIHIAKLFSEMPQFHRCFRSCNVGSKTGTWCGKCPKCLFTFIILSPFLKPESLISLFGGNLLEDKELEQIFTELTGMAEIKPFECIGTIDEVNLALKMTGDKYPEGKLPHLLQLYRDHASHQNVAEFVWPSLNQTEADHFVPEKYLSILDSWFS